MQFEPHLTLAKQLARQAGQAVLAVYRANDFVAFSKADESPVTSADLMANDIIQKGLVQGFPAIPIISEESAHLNLAQRQDWPLYWLIDPIDGTQEFIAKSGDFAVNIALVAHGQPVLGVIYWPEQDTLYFALKGMGAFKQLAEQPAAAIAVQQPQANGTIMLAISRRQQQHTVTQHFNQPERLAFLPLGSCSLKACFVAEGKANCFLRVGPTGEWDTGASQAIVEAAGGSIVDSQFQPLTYNQRESLANPNFMVLGHSGFNWAQHIKAYR